MASPSPSNIDQSTRKRGSCKSVKEEPVKKPKTGVDGVDSSFGKGGEDSDDRFPLSHFIPKKLASKNIFDVSSADVGGKAEKGREGAKGDKDSPGGSSGKSVPLIRVCKVSSSGNPSIHPKKNVSVVLADDDSENDELSGSDTEVEGSGEGGGGGEWNQSEVFKNDGKGYLASPESDPTENIERNPLLNQGWVGSSMFTFPGASNDLLASLDTLASSSFRSLTVAQMLQAVPMYGPAMKGSLELVAENQKLFEAAIFQKEMEETRTQLQGEQQRSRELEKHLNEAKAEQGKVKSLEERVVQLKQNEALLNAKLSDAADELTRQLDEAQKKHDMELTDGIKEC